MIWKGWVAITEEEEQARRRKVESTYLVEVEHGNVTTRSRRKRLNAERAKADLVGDCFAGFLRDYGSAYGFGDGDF